MWMNSVFPKDLEIQGHDFHTREICGACGCLSFLDRLRQTESWRKQQQQYGAVLGSYTRGFYKWVVLTSVNAAICTATDCN